MCIRRSCMACCVFVLLQPLFVAKQSKVSLWPNRHKFIEQRARESVCTFLHFCFTSPASVAGICACGPHQHARSDFGMVAMHPSSAFAYCKHPILLYT